MDSTLITQELIDKYVLKKVNYKGGEFIPIFRSIGFKNDTQEFEIGFKIKSREYLTQIYVPTIQNGMIKRNFNLWYPVHLVMPPIHFKKQNQKNSRYLSTIISNSMSCSSAVNFMDVAIYQDSKTKLHTPLLKELFTEEPKDIENIYNWNIIGLEYAILELFNHRIIQNIKRSVNNSYAGVKGISKAIHILINAMTRYYSDGDVLMYEDGVDENDEKMINSLSREDKQGVLLIHPIIKTVNIAGENPIDFCSCSQSLPMQTARIKSGVKIENAKFIGNPDFPYAYYRRGIPGILHDDPHRVIVSRSVTRAMMLNNSTTPYVETEVPVGIDTISLPGILMTHPKTLHDGIVVSETFASDTGSFKVGTQILQFPKNTHEVKFNVKECIEYDPQEIAMFLTTKKKKDISALDELIHGSIIIPGKIIGTVQYPNDNGEIVSESIKGNNKLPSVITSIEEIELITDYECEMNTYKIIFLTHYPVKLGTKFADLHGNKCTISEILPDEKMPMWENERVHYIMSPYVNKRLAVGAEVEDRLAHMGRAKLDKTGDNLIIRSDNKYPLKALDTKMKEMGLKYLGKVVFEGNEYYDIPLALRMIARIDNNPEEAITVSKDINIIDGLRRGKNSKLSLDLLTLVTRKANNLINEIIHQSKSRNHVSEKMIPMMYALIGKVPEKAEIYNITSRLDRNIIGTPVSYHMMHFIEINGSIQKRDFEGTVCDERCLTHYGIITTLSGEKFVVPPHDQFVVLPNGLVMLSKIAIEANRLFAEVVSESKAGPAMANLKGCIFRYNNALANMLSGKQGIVRDSILPVYRRYIRAVFSPYISNNITKIMVPRVKFNKIRKNDPDFEEFYQNKNMVIVKRDPVHRENNILGVTFDIWDNDTIGIHPALIELMDGDYDGDEGAVIFASTTVGYNDIIKLRPDIGAWFKGSKQLTGVKPNEINYQLIERTGWGSSFLKPHPTDECKRESTRNILMNGPSKETLDKLTIEAAKDFVCIKDGTALTGALGLRYIFTRPVSDNELLSGAMELYHEMAQCTLSAKAGTPVPSLNIVNAFRNASETTIKRGMRDLKFSNEEVIEDFIRFSRKCSTADGIMGILVDEFPLLAAIQSKLPYLAMKTIAERCLANETFNSIGMMESLYDYLLNRKRVYPFEYNINFKEIFENSKVSNIRSDSANKVHDLFNI